MGNNKMSFAAVIGFCGACIAFYIGAGFATFQEVIQYDASYGSALFIVVIVTFVIYGYTNLSFATNGARAHLVRGGDVYGHYCGKYIGLFYDYFSAFFCYLCFIVMCGGANSTVVEQWGLPNGVGAVILTVTVVATVVFGLDGIVNALGKLGPIIVILIFILSVWSIALNYAGIPHGMETVQSYVDSGTVSQVGGGNPFASGASYAGFVILWFAAFMAELGAKNKLREVNTGMILSVVALVLATILASLALLGDIDNTALAAVPSLTLANQISPIFGNIYAFVVFAGIYTTATPLLWTGVGRISREGTNRYRIATVVGGVVGLVVSCFLPYQGLVNIIYGINGYVGFILVAFMLIHDVRSKMGTNKVKCFWPGGEPEVAQIEEGDGGDSGGDAPAAKE